MAMGWEQMEQLFFTMDERYDRMLDLLDKLRQEMERSSLLTRTTKPQETGDSTAAASTPISGFGFGRPASSSTASFATGPRWWQQLRARHPTFKRRRGGKGEQPHLHVLDSQVHLHYGSSTNATSTEEALVVKPLSIDSIGDEHLVIPNNNIDPDAASNCSTKCSSGMLDTVAPDAAYVTLPTPTMGAGKFITEQASIAGEDMVYAVTAVAAPNVHLQLGASSPLLRASSTCGTTCEHVHDARLAAAASMTVSIVPSNINTGASANCSIKCPGHTSDAVVSVGAHDCTKAPAIGCTNTTATSTTISTVPSSISSKEVIMVIQALALSRHNNSSFVSINTATSNKFDAWVFLSELLATQPQVVEQPWLPPSQLHNGCVLRPAPWPSFVMTSTVSRRKKLQWLWKLPWPSLEQQIIKRDGRCRLPFLEMNQLECSLNQNDACDLACFYWIFMVLEHSIAANGGIAYQVYAEDIISFGSAVTEIRTMTVRLSVQSINSDIGVAASTDLWLSEVGKVFCQLKFLQCMPIPLPFFAIDRCHCWKELLWHWKPPWPYLYLKYMRWITCTALKGILFDPGILLEIFGNKDGQLDAARGLFERMLGWNVIFRNVLDEGYVRWGKSVDMLTMFWLLKMEDLEPDQFTLAGYLSVQLAISLGCCPKDWENIVTLAQVSLKNLSVSNSVDLVFILAAPNTSLLAMRGLLVQFRVLVHFRVTISDTSLWQDDVEAWETITTNANLSGCHLRLLHYKVTTMQANKISHYLATRVAQLQKLLAVTRQEFESEKCVSTACPRYNYSTVQRLDNTGTFQHVAGIQSRISMWHEMFASTTQSFYSCLHMLLVKLLVDGTILFGSLKEDTAEDEQWLKSWFQYKQGCYTSELLLRPLEGKPDLKEGGMSRKGLWAIGPCYLGQLMRYRGLKLVKHGEYKREQDTTEKGSNRIEKSLRLPLASVSLLFSLCNP